VSVRDHVDPELARVLGDVAEAQRAADRRGELVERCGVDLVGGLDDRVGLLDQDADDLAETQRDDRQVVALEAERGQADDVPEASRHEPADEQGEDKEPLPAAEEREVRERDEPREQAGTDRAAGPQFLRAVVRDHARDVPADRQESGVPHGELAGEAIDHVEGDGQNDVDADEDELVGVVRVDLRADHELDQEADREGGDERPDSVHRCPDRTRPQPHRLFRQSRQTPLLFVPTRAVVVPSPRPSRPSPCPGFRPDEGAGR
jgi:hypothetical protein